MHLAEAEADRGDAGEDAGRHRQQGDAEGAQRAEGGQQQGDHDHGAGDREPLDLGLDLLARRDAEAARPRDLEAQTGRRDPARSRPARAASARSWPSRSLPSARVRATSTARGAVRETQTPSFERGARAGVSASAMRTVSPVGSRNRIGLTRAPAGVPSSDSVSPIASRRPSLVKCAASTAGLSR